jgi:hypothetical protein
LLAPPAVVTRTSVPQGAGHDLVASFHGVLDLLRAIGQSAGPGAVLPTLVAQTHAVRGLAQQTSGSDSRELTLLAANFAMYTGWMAQEAGHEPAALWWTDEAAQLASHADDPELTAYAHVRRALVALYRYDAEGTVGHARLAAGAATATGRIPGLAALREAQGHALAGDHRACMLATERGERALAVADTAAELARRPAAGSRNVPDQVAMTKGWCLVDLGRPREAVAQLAPELDRMSPRAHRARARFGVRLALAHALTGDLDQAVATTVGVLDDAASVDSATIRFDLRGLRQALHRWHDHPLVQDLAPGMTRVPRAPLPDAGHCAVRPDWAANAGGRSGTCL